MHALLPAKQHCILCTEDPELQENVLRYLKDIYNFWPTTNSLAALTQIERRANCLVLVDLRFDGALPLLISIARRKGCVAIALGDPNTAPFRDAVDVGLYAVADIDSPYPDLQTLLEQAANQLASIEESHAITTRLAEQATRQIMLSPGVTFASSLAVDKIGIIAEVMGKAQSATDILEMVLGEISKQFLPTSVGVFALEGDQYLLRSGLRCPEESWSYRFAASDAFVHWMKIHGHLVTRKGLPLIEHSESRLMLGQVLDTLGADVLFPITHGSSLQGWICLGKQINGQSYSEDHFPRFLALSDQVATILEFLSASERNEKLQKISQTIVTALPYGLVLVGDDSRIVWSNDLAKHLLDLEDGHFHQEVDFIDTILADVVNRAAISRGRIVGGERQGGGGVPISINARALDTDPKAVLVLVEEDSRLVAAHKQIERAADIAIKFRGALTTIRTFSQLLGERATDPRFIAEFGKSMGSQVEELVGLAKELSSLRESGCVSP